jgi:sugar lactone lactonase YvrE
VLVGGLGFPEEPRWRDGALWFIDIWRKEVIGVDEAGAQVGRYELGFRPGGIGWLPDGELVVADLERNRVVAVQPGTGAQRTHADLSGLMRVRTNGLCAASDGTLYVTSIGSDLQTDQGRASGNIIRVAPHGAATVICDDDLMFPNGVALTPDEKFLVIAETFGERVAVLELGDSGRRWSVAAPGTYPDGVCAAGDDSFWFADARGKRCLQGSLAGEIIQTRQFSRLCYAPAVNADGSRLYTTAADGFDPTASARGNAAVVWTPLTP